MTREDRENLNLRVIELKQFAEGEPTAAAIILLGDHLVGVLDGILSRLRAIDDHLERANAPRLLDKASADAILNADKGPPVTVRPDGSCSPALEPEH